MMFFALLETNKKDEQQASGRGGTQGIAGAYQQGEEKNDAGGDATKDAGDSRTGGRGGSANAGQGATA